MSKTVKKRLWRGKIAELQGKNDSLYAEVNELRRQIKKYQHIEQMLEQEKRDIL